MVNQLVDRLPVLAERLWNPKRTESFEAFQARVKPTSERVMTVAQPVEILPRGSRHINPIEDLYQPYAGKEAEVRLVNRTKVPGEIRYEIGGLRGDVGNFMFLPADPPTASSPAFIDRINHGGAFIA